MSMEPHSQTNGANGANGYVNRSTAYEFLDQIISKVNRLEKDIHQLQEVTAGLAEPPSDYVKELLFEVAKVLVGSKEGP